MRNTPKTFSELFIPVFIMLGLLFSCSAAASETVIRDSLGMEFVLIPAGSFVMGSPADEPARSASEAQHQVTISKPFYMQATEVTLEQWWALMGKRFFARRKGTPEMPVTKVSWYDCMRFIEKLNARDRGTYRLPTEAEWEYACRATSSTAYSWGSSIDCTRAMYGNHRVRSKECVEYAKSRGFPVNRPAPVKSYPPNAWGLYDMHGNVWEWCEDWFEKDYPEGDLKDPLGPHSGKKRVKRGGSWFGPGHRCRSANRAFAHPSSKLQTTGFRLVWSEAAAPIKRKPAEEIIEPEESPQTGP